MVSYLLVIRLQKLAMPATGRKTCVPSFFVPNLFFYSHIRISEEQATQSNAFSNQLGKYHPIQIVNIQITSPMYLARRRWGYLICQANHLVWRLFLFYALTITCPLNMCAELQTEMQLCKPKCSFVNWQLNIYKQQYNLCHPAFCHTQSLLYNILIPQFWYNFIYLIWGQHVN